MRAAIALAVLLGLAPAARADVVDIANRARLMQCRGPGQRAALRNNPQLMAAAQDMANGQSLHAALISAGYLAAQSSALHLSGITSDAGIGQILVTAYCATLTDPTFAELGVQRQGRDVYIVLAAPAPVPRMVDAAGISRQILAWVNEARAQGRRCGSKLYPAAQALALNPSLTTAALAHSQEMAVYAQFDHRGHDGSTPATRVVRAGYGEYAVVGENIAAGAMTPREVTEGWLASPAHCENIMDARFTQIGIAFAVNRTTAETVYWTQDFASPRRAH